MRPPSDPGILVTRWWWVRHAPVPDGGRIYGQGDLDCDCSERHVFDAVAKLLPANAVWATSGLKRARQTADAIHAASKGKHAPKDMPAFAAWNEQHLGEWQGQDRHGFRKKHGISAMDFWLTKGDACAPGKDGESFHDLVARALPVIHDLNTKHAGRDIITVTHGGTIRAALGLAIGGDPTAAHAFTIDNVSVSVLEHLRPRDDGKAKGVWRLDGVNLRPWLVDNHGLAPAESRM